MIPNINNKQVFDSEFDLSKSPVIYSDPHQHIVYHRVSRHSDLLEYTLAVIEITDPSLSNSLIQNILTLIPITKSNPSLLELYTLYYWEKPMPNTNKSKKLLNIAILMEKFDYMLIDQQSNIDEKQVYELIGRTLSACQAYTPTSIQDLCVKSKNVKIIEFGASNLNNKSSDYLLLESPNIIASNANNALLHKISNFFQDLLKNTNFSHNRLKELLNRMKDPEISIQSLIDEYYQSSNNIKPPIGVNTGFPYAPNCKSHAKDCHYICRYEGCNSLLCEECVQIHKKSHFSYIIEYKEFLKGEINQGGSLKVLEELMRRIPEIGGLIEKKYTKAQNEITSLFSFLEAQMLKVLNVKKGLFMEFLMECRKDDNERLRIIEQQLMLHKKELQKLLEINEYRTFYLPEDLQRMLPFLVEVLSNFQPKFIEKIKILKLSSLQTEETLIKKYQSTPFILEMNQLTRKFSEILEKMCVFDPLLNDLEIEKLQTSFIEIKPTILPSPTPMKPVSCLLAIKNNRFIATYGADNKLIRSWDTAGFNEAFDKHLYTNNNGFLPHLMHNDNIYGIYKEKEVAIWDVKDPFNENLLKKVYSYEKAIYSLEIEANTLYIGCEAGVILVIELAEISNKIVKKQQIYTKCSEDIILLTKGKTSIDKNPILIVATITGSIYIYDIKSYVLLRSFDIKLKPTVLLKLEEDRLVIGTSSGSLQVWDCQKAILLRSLEDSHHDCISALAVSNKLKTVISVSKDSRLILWDIDKFYAKKLVLLPQMPIFTSLAWANENDLLACGTDIGSIYILDLGWELRKNEEQYMTRSIRQRSFFSKQSSDLTDLLLNEEDIERGKAVTGVMPWETAEEVKKKRKVSMFEPKKTTHSDAIKYQDDSVFDKNKANIWALSEKRKSSICQIF